MDCAAALQDYKAFVMVMFTILCVGAMLLMWNLAYAKDKPDE